MMTFEPDTSPCDRCYLPTPTGEREYECVSECDFCSECFFCRHCRRWNDEYVEEAFDGDADDQVELWEIQSRIDEARN